MVLSRATLPAEFFDVTSAMLLLQPEPQYLHGTLIKMALSAQLDTDAGLGITPDRAVTGPGAPYASAEASRFNMSDPIFGQAVQVVSELGKAPGHTVRINRPKFVNTTYTQASREVGAGTSISTTPVDLSSEQVAVTIKRFAGPYDSTNSRVAPYAVDRFDAKLAIHKLESIVGTHLKRDFDRTIDAFGVTLFDAASSDVYPSGMSAITDATVAGDYPLDLDGFWRAELTLDNANIPYFPDGHRVAVLHPRQINQLKSDSLFVKYAQYHKEINPLLMPAYEATLGKTHIFKSNTLTTTSSNVTIYNGQMFGPGMVGCGAGEMPRTAYSTADNYGEQALVIWLWYAGFATLDNRFGVRIRTS